MTATIADLSSNNGPVDYARLHGAGIVGTLEKASEGRTFNDPTFARRARRALSAGLFVGAYHFARPDHNDPEHEARHFVDVVHSLYLGRSRPATLRPVLDFEAEGARRLGGAHLTAWARAWNRVVKHELGIGPLFYSYPDYIAHMRPPWPIGDGLWLASYGRNDGRDHGLIVPRPWKHYLLHQFSSRCRVGGVHGFCDLSHAPKLWPLLTDPRELERR